ncbi:MAG: plastocyanin/azurin family copper-binding protein [Chitinophagaceae bacterium]
MRFNKIIFSWLLSSLIFIHARAQQNTDTITTISIGVKTGLQFDLVRFIIKPGSRVKIVFTNTDDMNHNLVVTRPGARLDVVNKALALGDKGPSQDYIPLDPTVLWSIPVVPPNGSKSISFTAPKEIGVYPYVCTLPGHGFVMFGAMYVSNNTNLPDIKKDVNIPAARREEKPIATGMHMDNDTAVNHARVKTKPLHPYTPIPPYLYRVFIEGASPAAIAVSLPRNISYCWDAGTCRLRFAWKGGFLDNSQLWKGKGDVSAIILGTIFFRDKTSYPFRIGNADSIPVVAYKGYRLINRYPEFHYTLNGTDVFELILPGKDGSDLVRTFRIPSANKTVWFCTDPDDGAAYRISTGKWGNGTLLLSPGQARQFSITMTKSKELTYAP